MKASHRGWRAQSRKHSCVKNGCSESGFCRAGRGAGAQDLSLILRLSLCPLLASVTAPGSFEKLMLCFHLGIVLFAYVALKSCLIFQGQLAHGLWEPMTLLMSQMTRPMRSWTALSSQPHRCPVSEWYLGRENGPGPTGSLVSALEAGAAFLCWVTQGKDSEPS